MMKKHHGKLDIFAIAACLPSWLVIIFWNGYRVFSSYLDIAILFNVIFYEINNNKFTENYYKCL